MVKSPFALLAAGVLVLALAGCQGGGSSGPTTAAPPSPPASSTSAAPSPSATAVSPSTVAVRCLTGDLKASLGQGLGGGAGHLYPYLVLTNDGPIVCTLSGYPGVSMVGGGSGGQLGAPAGHGSGKSVTLTLKPGQSAHSVLSITQAGNYDPTTCQPQAADGFRIYPPDETKALFVAATGYTGCANAAVKLLQVKPLQSGAK